MSHARRCVVSTVGTSVLTNRPDARAAGNLLRDTANLAGDALPAAAQELVDRLADQARAELASAPVPRLRVLSAELNGIYGLYDNRLALAKGDAHYLIATDTAQGRTTAELLAEHLRPHVQRVHVEVPRGFSTASTKAFGDGVREVVRWCAEALEGERAAGCRVVFNLVGGFKSMQGYMNTIGMFHADEIIYVFESPDAPLIRIPRLPVRVDTSLMEREAVQFAMMAEGAAPPTSELTHWPESLVEDSGGRAMLSTWGLLLWDQAKREVLSATLLDFPRLAYTDGFRRDFDAWPQRDEKVQLQEVLAKVSHLLTESGGDTSALRRDGGLQYSNMRGQPDAVGHFRVTQARRVSCVAGPKALTLHRFGDHDAVNDNPLRA